MRLFACAVGARLNIKLTIKKYFAVTACNLAVDVRDEQRQPMPRALNVQVFE